MKERAVKNNPTINAISRIAYGIAGSASKFYRLTSAERKHIRNIAAQLHEAGQTVGRAEEYMERNRNGFVYVIDHPRLDGVKVGRACNPEARLSGYQTGCPRREYRLRYAMYFEDCYTAEAEIHARLNAHQLEGEWFAIHPDEAWECIEWYGRQP